MCTKQIACVLEFSYLKLAQTSLLLFLNNGMAPAIFWKILAGEERQKMGWKKGGISGKKKSDKAIGRSKLKGE